MEVCLLGPLEVRDGDRLLSVRGSRQRALLALLALNAGRVMPAERLIELLWGDEAPPSAANALQVHVSNLRKVLEPKGQPYRLLVSDESGYALKIAPDHIDFVRFEQLVDRGHKALARGEVALSAQLLGEAADLWRGSALADLVDQPWSIGEARRLEELRLGAIEGRVEAELALGRHTELIGELESMIATYPFRERLRGQLMLALYRSGRQADASDVFQKTREVLVEELGMEPGLELQQLLRAILNQEPSLGVPELDRPTARLDNLPAALTSFVGREGPLTQLKQMLSANRLVTLTGPGGVGKTRLALQVARESLGKYQRGIWLTSFAGLTDPALVPEALAHVLAIRPQAGQSSMGSLIAAVGNRHYLMVFDNCEHLIDACARTAEALLTACPGVTVLATSREALGVAGEVTLSVPPMQVTADGATGLSRGSEAIELFQQRAASAVGSFRLDDGDLAVASHLCRRLDGIPLAIELAATKLKVMSLHELVVRLDDRFRVLTEGSRTAMPRQQTLRATLDWSYDLLPPADRVLLPMLSVFTGTFSLQAAEAVCAVNAMAAGDILDGLSNLARKSLVQVERSDFEVRYRLLDSIRDYGHEKLEEAGHLVTLSTRHRDFYLDLAERAEPQVRGSSGSVWMARLVSEHDNIRAALRWSQTAGDGEKLVRFTLALGWFWQLRCFFREGRAWLDAALRFSDSTTTRARLLIQIGELAWAQGDHASGRPILEEALSLAVEAGDEALIADALVQSALLVYSTGEYELVQQRLEAAVSILRKQGDPLLLAEALNNLGWLLGMIFNQAHEAVPLLEESLLIAGQNGNQWLHVAVLDSLGNLELAQGRLDAARAFQEESLRICRALTDRSSLPTALEGFVKLACASGQFERALCIAGAAARLRDEVGATGMPRENAEVEALIKQARSHLPESVADAAWRDGWQMTETDAISYALSNELASLNSP